MNKPFTHEYVPALLVIAALTATTHTQVRPVFEVAAVRMTPPNSKGILFRITDSSVDISNYPLRPILRMAFRVKEYQLISPDWTRQDRFSIQAVIPTGATRADVPDMLQELLRTRFGLVTHMEPRRMPAYNLVIADKGIKMQEVEPKDDVMRTDIRDPSGKALSDVTWENVEGPSRVVAMTNGSIRRITNRSMYDRRATQRLTTELDATRITMPEFASVLAEVLDRPVIDATNLAGVYQFKTELPTSATFLRVARSIGMTRTLNGTPFDEPNGVSAEEALKRLGLKLVSRKEPIAVVVVDRITRTPTEN